MTERELPVYERGSGVCAACGGKGWLIDKPHKSGRETMACPHCAEPDKVEGFAFAVFLARAP